MITLKETLEEAKHNADAFTTKVPFINNIPFFIQGTKDDEGLLQPDDIEDLDKTYVPLDENE